MNVQDIDNLNNIKAENYVFLNTCKDKENIGSSKVI